MSRSTYHSTRRRKRTTWLVSTIKTPPFSEEARGRTGRLIGRLQIGETLPMPFSRPMPNVGARCHELRIKDGNNDWRVIYRIDAEEVILAEVFQKTSRATPRHVIELCQWRLRRYDLWRKER
jgi:phage-related protein